MHGDEFVSPEEEEGGPVPPESSLGLMVSSDPLRIMETDIAGENSPAPDGSPFPDSALSGTKIPYLHDSRRVSAHPLGPVTAPDGVTGRFWRRLDEIPPEEPEDREPVTDVAPAFPLEQKPAPDAPSSGRLRERGAASGGGGGDDSSGESSEEHDPSEMPFLDHLEELRWMLLKSIVVIVLAMIASWYLSDWFYNEITDLAKGGKAFLGNRATVDLALSPLGRHPGTVSGVITDQKTKKPIPGATVLLVPGNYTTQTDSTGKYSITGIPEGSYTITAARDGYTPDSRNSGMKLVMTTVMEPLLIRLQMALVMGLILALPLVFYFGWSFVAPGLYENERRWVLPLIFAATGCFFVGAALAWYVVIPYMLGFLQAFMPADVEGMFTFSKFLGIIIKFTLSFGIIFELPMVSFALAKIGVLKHTFMQKYRAYAIVLIFIISAVITPTVDPVTQTLMAVPLYLLYEVSIVVARFAGRKTII